MSCGEKHASHFLDFGVRCAKRLLYGTLLKTASHEWDAQGRVNHRIVTIAKGDRVCGYVLCDSRTLYDKTRGAVHTSPVQWNDPPPVPQGVPSDQGGDHIILVTLVRRSRVNLLS